MFLRSGKHVDSESPIAKKRKVEIVKCEKKTILRNYNQLLQDCISHLLSLTTPRGACVLSSVSPTFRSMVDSDATWQRFLPSDYASFLSHAIVPIEHASKKELFFRLCDHPVPIYGGKMAFGLEKSSGAKCFTISARAMSMSFIDSNCLWKWVPLFNSRFSEAVQLCFNSFLNKDAMAFSGRIATKTLSAETTYTAYLIYRCTYYEFRTCIPASFLESSVEIGMVNAYNIVCLHPKCNLRSDVEWPMRRRDRWMEVKVEEFYVKGGEDEKVKIKLQKSEGDEIPCILLLGMEIRANSVDSMIRKT
ncbi:putative F-box protein PP2-B12 isoform X1 [Carex rostrata]